MRPPGKVSGVSSGDEDKFEIIEPLSLSHTHTKPPTNQVNGTKKGVSSMNCSDLNDSLISE